MTKEESRAKTDDKVHAIKVLLRQLEVTLEAKQIITKDGVLENTVVYRDNEKYKIDEKVPAPIKEDKKND